MGHSLCWKASISLQPGKTKVNKLFIQPVHQNRSLLKLSRGMMQSGPAGLKILHDNGYLPQPQYGEYHLVFKLTPQLEYGFYFLLATCYISAISAGQKACLFSSK